MAIQMCDEIEIIEPGSLCCHHEGDIITVEYVDRKLGYLRASSTPYSASFLNLDREGKEFKLHRTSRQVAQSWINYAKERRS